MADEYRVLYNTETRCNCPDCPVRTHTSLDIEYGTYTEYERARRGLNKAYNIEDAVNVRIMKRTVGDWEEVF